MVCLEEKHDTIEKLYIATISNTEVEQHTDSVAKSAIVPLWPRQSHTVNSAMYRDIFTPRPSRRD